MSDSMSVANTFVFAIFGQSSAPFNLHETLFSLIDFTMTSAEHSNWLAVGEIMRLVQVPTSSYVDHIVKKFHENLCNDFDKNSKCTSKHCKKMTPACDLCGSCQKWWLKELKNVHIKGSNPSGEKNCDGKKWYENHWEVAKYYMSALGNDRSNVTDAESTELPALLNVLEWMKDDVFPGKTRIKVDDVRKLRSDVRNTWAHAPEQELSDHQKDDYFKIAIDFLEEMKKLYPIESTEIDQSIESLKSLKKNGISDLVKSELQILALKSNILNGIKIEIHSLDEAEIHKQENQLKSLEHAMNECLQRTAELTENTDKQVAALVSEMKTLTAIPNDLREIRETLSKITAAIANLQNASEGTKEEPTPLSCLQDKMETFTARESEIQTIMSSLQTKETAVVSLHGGPGFGKSALAVEVSHRLYNNQDKVVIFSDMSSASTINEIILRLCLDIGLNPEEDWKSSLILWLRSIGYGVIFVMDGIDEILNRRDDWHKFILLLRKSSNQQCQFITTSRTEYEINGISTVNVPVQELDDNSSLALLKAVMVERCPGLHVGEEYSGKLAKLCGNIPLALCIAASRVQDFKDPQKLLEHLEREPLETLQDSKSNQFVYKAINMSYEKLTDEQQRSLVRLAVFKGNFSEDAVQAVIEKDDLATNNVLKELATRSLLKKISEGRYSIHDLIRHFLNKMNDIEIETATNRMVEYYLNLCHTSAVKSYTKDGFKKEREILKREAHNIENTLIKCSSTDSKILDVLANSEIYKSSYRFFYHVVKTFISETVLETFLKACADLAQERKEWKNKLNFDCILVDHEGRKSLWKSDAYSQKMIEAEQEFREHEKDLKGDVSLQAYFFFQYGRYFLNQSKKYNANSSLIECLVQLDNLHSSAIYLLKSWTLRKSLTESPFGKTDVILTFIQLGNLRKSMINLPVYKDDREKCNKQAEKFYKEAIELVENNLNEHELTAACYKALGDMLLGRKDNDNAMQYYKKAKQMREQLNLVTSRPYVLLLNNIGRCLMYMKNFSEGKKILKEAQKLAEDGEQPECEEKVRQSLDMLEEREAYEWAREEAFKPEQSNFRALKQNTDRLNITNS